MERGRDDKPATGARSRSSNAFPGAPPWLTWLVLGLGFGCSAARPLSPPVLAPSVRLLPRLVALTFAMTVERLMLRVKLDRAT